MSDDFWKDDANDRPEWRITKMNRRVEKLEEDKPGCFGILMILFAMGMAGWIITDIATRLRESEWRVDQLEWIVSGLVE